MLDVIGGNVPLNVMDSDQRLLSRIGDGLCLGYAHQKRAYQAWPVGHADSVHLLQCHPRLRKGRFHHLVNLFNMFPRRDLGHHSAIDGVECDLGGDDVGQHFPAVLHHRRRGLITGALNRQYIDIFLSMILFHFICLINLHQIRSDSAVHLHVFEEHENTKPGRSALCQYVRLIRYSNSSSTVHASFAAFARGKISLTLSINSSGLVREGL